MNFIDNAWETVRKSYAVWLGWALGAYGAFLSIELSMLTADEQIAWHVASQSHWFPFVTAVLGIFGITALRAVKQDNSPPKQ
jgi:hypothetical protein